MTTQLITETPTTASLSILFPIMKSYHGLPHSKLLILTQKNVTNKPWCSWDQIVLLDTLVPRSNQPYKVKWTSDISAARRKHTKNLRWCYSHCGTCSGPRTNAWCSVSHGLNIFLKTKKHQVEIAVLTMISKILIFHHEESWIL